MIFVIIWKHILQVPVLDCIPQGIELEYALNKIRKGTGLDGIPAPVVKLKPQCILNNILSLLQRCFVGSYPKSWEKQILNAIPKSGHSPESPKLRGVAVAPMFARLYDCILGRRVCEWYTPNREQAGFRNGQGCSLQLFSVILLIHYSKKEKKNFIVGFLDYEKAFDYANRANLVSKLIDKGCGQMFTKAVAKMYMSTTYVHATNNKLCEEISTSYGMAQGRHSSPNFYSSYVSDMPRCTDILENNDFMDPYNLAQLADDSIVLAESVNSFKEKMNCLLCCSKEIFQIPNISKTVFCHLSENPLLEPLHIDTDTVLSSVDVQDGYKYLGMNVLPSNDMNKIIMSNLNQRMGSVCKFNWD